MRSDHMTRIYVLYFHFRIIHIFFWRTQHTLEFAPALPAEQSIQLYKNVFFFDPSNDSSYSVEPDLYVPGFPLEPADHKPAPHVLPVLL